MHVHPGKSAMVKNTCIREYFNQVFHEKVPGVYLFDVLQRMPVTTEHLLQGYNTIRPHDTLQDLILRRCAIHLLIFCLQGRLTKDVVHSVK